MASELPEKVGHVAAMPQTGAENIAAATQLKLEGTARLKAGDFKNARMCYQKMIVYLKHLDAKSAKGGEMAGLASMTGGMGGSSPADDLSAAEKDEVSKLMMAMNANLSLCFLKLEKWEQAIQKATLVLDENPDHKVVRYRRAQAYAALKDTDKAAADLELCEQSDSAVIKLRKHVEKLEQQAMKKQKKQFAGLFDKMSAETPDEPKAEETSA